MSSLDLASAATQDSELRKHAADWRALIISPRRELLNELNPVIRQCMPGTALVEVLSYPDVKDLAGYFTSQPPNIVFLDCITTQDRALGLVPELIRIDRTISIIALLASNEPQQILRCLRQGAGEFLLQPFDPEQLDASLAKLIRALPKEKQGAKSTAKIVCVMPAKGACGASTLASNLAFHAKRSGSERVLLADLDPLTGTISFLLKSKSTYSFIDVLAHADHLDIDLWKAMVCQRHGIDVLLSPETLVPGVNDVRDATAVIEFARTHYDVVVLDAPSVYGEWNLSQAKLCDDLLLVTTNELPALQATQRALSYLETNRIGRWKIHVVVNRYDKEIGLSKDVIGTALHTDIYHVVPSDYEAVQKSLLEGKAIPPTTSLGKSFTTLGDRVTGAAKPKKVKTGSSFGSLLSLFSRTSS